jgi:hypothetical protein
MNQARAKGRNVASMRGKKAVLNSSCKAKPIRVINAMATASPIYMISFGLAIA